MENDPDFGFLTGEFGKRVLQTFALDEQKNEVEFAHMPKHIFVKP